MSQSNQDGVLKDGTTEPRQGSQSTNAGSRSTLGTSGTTAEAQSQKDSQRTPNLQDAPNAARLILALSGKLGALVEWRRLVLRDGREVYALVFPADLWKVDPVSRELTPR